LTGGATRRRWSIRLEFIELWDGRAAMSSAALEPVRIRSRCAIVGPGHRELRRSHDYPELFGTAFGRDITSDRVVKAIGQSSDGVGNSRYDR
jgi:hypothetical protein